MKKILFTLRRLVFAASLLISSFALAIDLSEIENSLNSEGLTGWIHGADGDRSLFVFTYRNPKNFFDSIQFSLISEKTPIQDQLKILARHDRIRIKGYFMQNLSAQKHIQVTSLETIKEYVSGHPTPPYKYEAQIPSDLTGKSSELFLVHAIAQEGRVLVLEYKDAVLPIYLTDNSVSKGLYRNDVVRVKYGIQSEPVSPTHLMVNESEPTPIEVLERVVEMHGKPARVEGALVMFPKSPDIMFNVFCCRFTFDTWA